MRDLIYDESGGSWTEYLLIIALVAIAVVAALTLFADRIIGCCSMPS